jgi:hypothetical protein
MPDLSADGISILDYFIFSSAERLYCSMAAASSHIPLCSACAYDMLMQHLMSALLVATSILSSQTSAPLLYFSTLCFYKVVSGLFEVFPPYAVCILRYAAGPALECKPSAT